jgi:hypothetical protein
MEVESLAGLTTDERETVAGAALALTDVDGVSRCPGRSSNGSSRINRTCNSKDERSWDKSQREARGKPHGRVEETAANNERRPCEDGTVKLWGI